MNGTNLKRYIVDFFNRVANQPQVFEVKEENE